MAPPCQKLDGVIFSVGFGRFRRVVGSVMSMGVSGYCVVRSLFVIARLMVFGRFVVMLRRMLVVFGCFLVVLACFF